MCIFQKISFLITCCGLVQTCFKPYVEAWSRRPVEQTLFAHLFHVELLAISASRTLDAGNCSFYECFSSQDFLCQVFFSRINSLFGPVLKLGFFSNSDSNFRIFDRRIIYSQCGELLFPISFKTVSQIPLNHLFRRVATLPMVSERRVDICLASQKPYLLEKKEKNYKRKYLKKSFVTLRDNKNRSA